MLAAILDRFGRDPSYLLQILRDAQEARGWIDAPAVSEIASALSLSPAAIEGTLRFYSFLHSAPSGRYRILVSDNITDRMLGNAEVTRRLSRQLGVAPGEVSPDGLVGLDFTSCTGMCDQGPAVLVNGRAVTHVTPERADIIAELIRREVPLGEWPAEFFTVTDNVRRPDLLLTSHWGPGDALSAAIARGAEGMLGELEASRLRGRGGAGFPTATKWKAARAAEGDTRYVVCNADEGEPGTFKDRVLLQSHAGRVVEGMAIGAHAIGARRGYIYLRGEYAYLRPGLEGVLADMRGKGLLGTSILGVDGFDFDIEIHLGAGAYICGEESALLESLEGKPGRPRIRPPFPVTHGLHGKPTVVNNVETLAAVTLIALNGGRWFQSFGTPRSSGTKVLSVSGDCERPGLYEYPFGVRVSQVLADCGARHAKAVQISGASGTCLSERDFARRIAFEDVPTAGAFMVFGESRDMFEMARNFAHFFAHESCGFCTPCRVGTALVRNYMDEIGAGHGTHYTVNEIMTLADLMRRTSHCGLGQTACNAILDTFAKFRPSWDRRLTSTDFEPTFDLDAALASARALTGRDDAGAHLENGD
jgi:[NiFe] hydrogenase diaphorase moiety large subunit